MSVNLSGVIICQSEENLITTSIDNIYPYVDELVLLDGGSLDSTVEVIKNYPDKDNKIRLFKNKFNNHFGDQKNLAFSKVKGFWILNIDADETLEQGLLEELPQLIEQNKYHVYKLPRKNYIDGVQTEVYPDYQLRLFRAFCRFTLPIHEELVGFHHEKIKSLDGDGYHIIHKKSTKRQMKQNSLYGHINDTTNFGNGNFIL